MIDPFSVDRTRTMGGERPALSRYATRTPMAAIVRGVSEAFGVTQKDLLGTDRYHHIAHPRFAAFELCHRAGAPLSAIGRKFNRDHTTVMHGLRRIPEIEASDPDFAWTLERLRNDLKFGRLPELKSETVKASPAVTVAAGVDLRVRCIAALTGATQMQVAQVASLLNLKDPLQ